MPIIGEECLKCGASGTEEKPLFYINSEPTTFMCGKCVMEVFAKREKSRRIREELPADFSLY